VNDPLEVRARAWLAPWPNSRHLLRTRDWLLILEPRAGLALRLAALSHDAERNFPGSPLQSPERPAADRAYRDAHQARSAEIVDAWLADQRASPALRRSVSGLVAVHEWGGWREADLLQAADSISFLEVTAADAPAWIGDHGHPPQRVADQLDWMYSRIAVDGARELARAFHERAFEVLAPYQARSNAGVSPASSWRKSGSPRRASSAPPGA
jgi:hypothetical protein